MRRWVLWWVAVAMLVVAAGCAADDDGGSTDGAAAGDDGGRVEQPERSRPPAPDRPPTWPEGFDPDADDVEQVSCPAAVPDDEGILCAFVVVPADHAEPTGAKMALMVAVIPPVNGSTAPPVLYLEGGPGFGAVPEAESWVEPPLDRLSVDRAVVLVDQRGTGYSRPHLDCPELAEYGDEDPDVVAECRALLTADGIDPGWYSSAASAADVALLRQLLGVDEWDLMGSSYGSRLALTVLRDDPTGVRAVAIDGIYPPDADGAGVRGVRQSVLFAMDTFVELCADDEDCLDLLGDPAAVLVDAVAELERQWEEDPEAYLDGADLLFALPNLLVDPDLAWLLLGVAEGYEDAVEDLDEAIAVSLGYRRQRIVAAGALVGVDDDAAATESTVMRLSLDCIEEVPFAEAATPEVAGAAWPGWLLDLVDAQALASACDVWDVPAADGIEAEPVASDLPVLLISGLLDAVTPPVWARQAVASLPNGQLVSVPHLGHDAVVDECVVEIVIEFFGEPLTPVDTGCLADIEPFRYEI
ncbi:MAG: alpha/beta fold hydrolase [Acidimicrobiia bacterium]|nr:alpha/beta fold hydrolase [Acidimicrobiia bacterium]